MEPNGCYATVPYTPNAWIRGTPHRTQPRTPNPVTSIVHMSRSHLKCHCLGWFLPWMEKNTRRLILILWIIMKNPVCPPCIKLKLYIHKKGHTHINIYILYIHSIHVFLWRLPTYYHMGYDSQKCTPCSHTSSTAQGGGGSFKKRKTIGEIGCCESRMSKQKHWPTD